MIQIETTGSAAIQAALQRLRGALDDMRPALGEIGQALEENIRIRFVTKTDPAGQAWEPYKAISAAIHKARKGTDINGSLLLRTRTMEGSTEHHVGADFVEVGLSDQKAIFHEFGTSPRGKKGGGAIPRRGMVFGAVSGQGKDAQVTQALSAGDEADVMEIIQSHIQRAMGGLG